jgi:toxin ParE1/3/4
MSYAFHPEARLEYLAAVEYYEARKSGLGGIFSIEVEAAIARIIDAPERWPIIGSDVRRCLTHTFPYGILYTVELDSIFIVAVMHCSRKPGYWKAR